MNRTMDGPGPEPEWVRYLGIVTAVGLATLILASRALPRRAATIVGALALIVVVIAGSQFVFHGATIVSKALAGRRRTRFQAAVSVAVPVFVLLLLIGRVDAVPLATLREIVTPWLVVAVGIVAWVCWFTGPLLDREHPFRGFVIAAGALGLLCLFWSAGMTSDADYDGEG